MAKGLDYEIVGLHEFPLVSEIPETGNTFIENARLKAAGYAANTGLVSLADDSGLEVAALGGRPGVLSARYGGDDIGFDQKMSLLLKELRDLNASDRSARFACSIALASPDGEILFESSGFCNGQLAKEPRGKGGFGYDPLFIPDGYEATFGELDPAIKDAISHRAAAFREIIPFLRHFSGFST